MGKKCLYVWMFFYSFIYVSLLFRTRSIVEPSLKGIRAINRTSIPTKLNILRENVNPSVIQLLYGATRPFNE